MSPVRRRAVGAEKKKRRTLWLLLPLLAVMFVGGWLLLHNAPVSLPEVVPSQSVTLSNRASEEVISITITGPYDTPYTLQRDIDGVWEIKGYPSFAFRQTMLDAMVDNAAVIITDDTIGRLSEHSDWHTDDFGLQDGCLRVEVAYSDGSHLAFRLGDPVPEETPGYFFMLEGDDRIFTMSTDVFEAYANTRMALHTVSEPALKGDLIDRITFSGRDPFILERSSDGWYLTDPVVYPLAASAVDSLLDKLEGVRFAQYVGLAEDCDLASLGLDPAERILTLDIAESTVTGYDADSQVTGSTVLPAYQLELSVGNEESEIVFYCLYRGVVNKATSFSAGFLRTQDWNSLLLAAPFNSDIGEINSLTWSQDAQTWVYNLSFSERILPNNELERDENGNVIYDVNVSCNGQETDSEAFAAAYGRLCALRMEDRLPVDYSLPQGEPLLMVEIMRNDGKQRTITLWPLDALHDAVAVNGVALFRVEKGWADSINWP